jgi:hypothetical protein
LTAGELSLFAVIDEAVLARVIGDPQTMVEQLDHLIGCAALPSVTLQVVPFAAGSYPGLDGAFQHMHFGDGRLGDVVFVEGLHGNFLLEKDVDIQRYVEVFGHISQEIALPPDDTVSWLRGVRARWAGRAGPVA